MSIEEGKNISNLFSNIAICLNVICFLQVILAVILPDILTSLVKTWLVIVFGGGFIALSIGLFLTRSDPNTNLFLTTLSTFLSGFFCGISTIVIVLK